MAELLSAVEPILSEALVSQVGASYQVDIILPGGARSTFFIDLSSGGVLRWGGCSRGSPRGRRPSSQLLPLTPSVSNRQRAGWLRCAPGQP